MVDVSKHAVIHNVHFGNDIFDDLDWTGNAYLVWGAEEDLYLFLDMSKAKCEEWANIRDYVVMPVDEYFEYINDRWERR